MKEDLMFFNRTHVSSPIKRNSRILFNATRKRSEFGLSVKIVTFETENIICV